MSLTKETSFGTECTKQWHDLIVINDNECYCDSCAKPLIDFTKWNRDEILEYFKSHSHSCGKFRIEQVDPSIVEIKVSLPKKFFKSVFVLVTLLWSYEAKSQSENKSHTAIEYKLPDCSEDSVTVEKNQSQVHPSNYTGKAEITQREKINNHKKKYFISRRFPFIHKRRSYHFMGCPAF